VFTQGLERAIISLTAERPTPTLSEIVFDVSPRVLRGITDMRVSSDPTILARLVQLEDAQVCDFLGYVSMMGEFPHTIGGVLP